MLPILPWAIALLAALTLAAMGWTIRQEWRRLRVQMRDLAVRHARERAAFTAWEIEVRHRLREREHG